MNTQDLHELAKKLAPLIGYEYKPAENRSRDGEPHWLATMSGKNGALNVGRDRTGKRFEVSVSWPRKGEYGASQVVSEYRRNGRKHEITVSPDKSPEKIAKDIKSRLLSDAESLYQEAMKDLIAEMDHQAKKQAAIRRVAALVGKGVSDRDLSEYAPYFYFGKNTSGKVTVNSATSIKVEIDADINNIAKVIEFAKSLEAK